MLGVCCSLFAAVLGAFCLADSHYFPKGRGPIAGQGGTWHLVFIRRRVQPQTPDLTFALNKAESDSWTKPAGGASPARPVKPGVSRFSSP